MATSKQNLGWITDHVKLYKTDPEKAHQWDSALGGYHGIIPVLLLITKGRKTGKEVNAPLIYRKQPGGKFSIIASKGGAPDHPDWYLNLLKDPIAEIQVGKDHYRVKAHTVPEGAERDRMWEDHVSVYPLYNDYQKRAGTRKIQIVLLEPIQ
jgi:proline iminopeptidase